MPSKSYSVRIAAKSPEVSSEQVVQLLDAFLASPAELGPDPGAGDRTLRLSLDADQVKTGAKAVGEAEAVFLRRLIASNVQVPAEGAVTQESEPTPKALVLKGSLKLRQEQIRPLISLVDAGQSFALRRVFRLPPEPEVLQAAAYTEVEKDQLSAASVELVNRRAPKWLVENADVIGFLSTFSSIELQKIERLKALAEHYHATQQASKRAAAPPAQEPTPGIVGGVQ